MVVNRGGRDLVRPYGPGFRKLDDREYSLLLEDAQILFLNFSGRPGIYNAEGERNFCVLVDAEVAEDMRADGWNVKQLKGRDDEEGDHYIQIKVKYRDRFGKPLQKLPKIVLQSSRGRNFIGEDEVNLMDMAEFTKVDLIVNGRVRDEDGVTKVAGYLRTMYATLYEDYLDRKYSITQVEGEEAPPLELEMSQEAQDAKDGIVDGEIVGED